LLGTLAGLQTSSEILRWRPKEGNLVCVAPRAPGFAPHFFETEAAWMWHAANAYEEGGVLFVDFVGIDGSGVNPALFEIMKGKVPKLSATPQSHLRRYLIEPSIQRLGAEVFRSDGNLELPFVCQNRRGLSYRYAYSAKADAGKVFWNRVTRIDPRSGKFVDARFGEDFCGEPVFIPDPRREASEGGWVLTQVYSPASKKSSLAVLDSEHLEDGPLATVKLRHHVPLSFHGYWHGA
jgi:all-trans-8'-apo-beta-carotenal 15,15'-oxygenase